MDKDEKPGMLDDYTCELIRTYEIMGEKEKYKQELTDYVLDHRQRDMMYVHMLKNATLPVEWPMMRERIIESGTLGDYYELEFLLSEGLYERLFSKLTLNGRLYDYCRYEDVFRERFPEKSCKVLLEMIDREMNRANTRGNYYTVIQYLKRVRKYSGGKEKAQALADSWKVKFPRRSAMLDELSKAKF